MHLHQNYFVNSFVVVNEEFIFKNFVDFGEVTDFLFDCEEPQCLMESQRNQLGPSTKLFLFLPLFGILQKLFLSRV